ncbi:MAG: rhodanese-like domain-containing protein [Thermoleophilia bacterium]
MTDSDARAMAAAAVQARTDGTVLARSRQLIDSTPMSGEYTANALWGTELRQKLAAGEDFFILDIRDREDYEQGHIPGAVHAQFSDWTRPQLLQTLPSDRRIAVICDTGDAASQVVAGLRLLGFDAVSVKTGIMGWAQMDATAGLVEAVRTAAHSIQRTPPERVWPERDAVAPLGSPSKSQFSALAACATAVMAETLLEGDYAANIISPTALSYMLGEVVRGEGYFLLDVRREEDYEGVGHIPGAAHIDFESVLSDEALALLPPDKKIITICYTGNLAAQLAMVLRMLGHDAAVLGHGMACWSKTPTAIQYLKDIQGADGELASI